MVCTDCEASHFSAKFQNYKPKVEKKLKKVSLFFI